MSVNMLANVNFNKKLDDVMHTHTHRRFNEAIIIVLPVLCIVFKTWSCELAQNALRTAVTPLLCTYAWNCTHAVLLLWHLTAFAKAQFYAIYREITYLNIKLHTHTHTPESAASASHLHHEQSTVRIYALCMRVWEVVGGVAVETSCSMHLYNTMLNIYLTSWYICC